MQHRANQIENNPHLNFGLNAGPGGRLVRNVSAVSSRQTERAPRHHAEMAIGRLPGSQSCSHVDSQLPSGDEDAQLLSEDEECGDDLVQWARGPLPHDRLDQVPVHITGSYLPDSMDIHRHVQLQQARQLALSGQWPANSSCSTQKEGPSVSRDDLINLSALVVSRDLAEENSQVEEKFP